MNKKSVFITMGLLLCGACKNNDKNSEATCEEMVVTICESACRCGEPDDICMYYIKGAQEGFSSQVEDEESCVLMDTVLYCSDNIALEMDFDACAAEIDPDACGEYDDQQGLRLPGACAAIGGMEDAAEWINDDGSDGPSEYDEAHCMSVVSQLCDANDACVDSGSYFFTESGSYAGGTFLSSEGCIGDYSSICNPDYDIDYNACEKVIDEATCTEDSDKELGLRVPEACKWITGDLT